MTVPCFFVRDLSIISIMYYKIVEKFGPDNGDRWRDYLQWRGLNLTSFDSVDGILRPNLFDPESKEDWANCVNENCKLNLITNINYAKFILNQYKNAALVGVNIELDESYTPREGLLGFDIIDGYCDVSLVTNWGADEAGILNQHIMPNGLIKDLYQALKIRDLLRKDYSNDSHAGSCEVWAIYN